MVKNKRTLEQELSNRNNGLDILKMMAAVLVILAHSVPITRGMGKEDFLSVWTKGYLNLGGVAVAVFFFFGGIYIAKSAESKKTTVNFFRARCKRIFPELWLMVLCCVVVLGSIVTNLPLKEYFGQSKTYEYLLNGVFYLKHNLPGVFSSNPYAGVVNGPLWTLPVEFVCYIGCFVLYKTGFFRKKSFVITIPIVIVGIIGTRYVFANNIFLLTVLRPVFLFYLGILCYIYRENIVLSTRYAIITAILFVLLLFFKLQLLGMLLCFPYICLWFVYQIKKPDRKIRFEFTYGMYLWGWPIQQSLMVAMDDKMSWQLNALLAIVLAALAGYVSNKIISKVVK